MRYQISIHPHVTAGPEGPSTKQTKQSVYQPIHLRQSHLDEACGIHCVFMALIALHVIARTALVDVTPSMMRHRVSVLTRGAKRRWFGGLLVGGLLNILKPMNNKLFIDATRASDKSVLHFVLEHLAKERLVIVGIQNAKLGLYHWVLVVGYGGRPGKVGVRTERIYILDPNRPVWPMSQWNGEIDVHPRSKRGRMRMWRDSQGIERPVVLDGAVAIGNR